MNLKILCLLSVMIVTAQIASAKSYVIKSPNNKIELTVTLDEAIHYSVKSSGQIVLDESVIALQLLDGGTLGENPKVVSKKERTVNEEIKSPFYRFASVKDNYRALDLKLKNGYGVQFRSYDLHIVFTHY